jgi:hypothetical protein
VKYIPKNNYHHIEWQVSENSYQNVYNYKIIIQCDVANADFRIGWWKFKFIIFCFGGLGWRSQYSDSLQDGRSEVQTSVGAMDFIFSTLVETGPVA